MTELLYIDEEPRELRKILRLAVASKYFSQQQVEQIKPLPDIDETIEAIFATGCKVLITDFRLGEKDDSIDYTGTELVAELRKRSNMLPCFMTTSFPEHAIKTDFDAFNIFSKGEIEEEENKEQDSRLTFFQRVRQAVDRSNFKYKELSDRHQELSDIQDERPLTEAETEEFIELDMQLDRGLSFQTTSSAHVKKVALDNFEKLVEKTNAIINDVKSRLEEEGNAE